MGILDNLSDALSGSNRFNTGPSSNNSTPDAPDQTSAQPQPSPASQLQTPPQSQPQQMGSQLTGVKGYLSNIFYQMGEAAKAHLGMPTDVQVQQNQQKLNIEKQRADQENSIAQQKLQQQMQLVTLPNGMQVPFALAKPYLDSQTKTQVATIGANAKITGQMIGKRYIPVAGVGMFDTQPANGGDPQLVPGSNPVSVTVTDEIAKEYGVPQQLVGKNIPIQQFSSLLRGQAAFTPTVTNSTKTMEATINGQPTVVQVPQTSTTRKAVQGAAPSNQSPKSPVNLTTNPSGIKVLTGPDGQPLMGKGGSETGFAFDPATKENYLTTRSDAATKGYQNFTKASAAQIESTRQLNNRLADVQQKIERYQGAANQPLSAGDKYAISKLMSDQHFEAAFKPFGVGVTIPTGFITELDRAAQANGLSDAGRNKLISYMNAREAMVGYQRVLSGSGRGNEKQMEMLLQTLPSPITDSSFANEGFKQFRENLRIAGQGLPKIPGVQSASDIENKNAQSETKYYQGIPYTKGPDGQWHKAKQ